MAEQMTHWERVRAALRGDEVDRPPISAWRHFYQKENSVEGLAEAMLGFQRQHDWDFMKVNPRANYHAEDWGLRQHLSHSDIVAPEVADWPVKKSADLATVQPLEIQGGVLGQHLQALGRIAKGLDGEVPFLMTVFTPLSIAGRLAESDDAMLGHIRERPDLVHQALEAITDTFARFARESIGIGAGGIFFATTTWGTYDRLTDAEYAEFGRPYDLRILEAVQDAEFNILHVCKSHNMLRSLADYPVAAFNWDAQDDTNLDLDEGHRILEKTVIGGVSHRSNLPNGSPENVQEEANGVAKAMSGAGWLLGPACSITPESPKANLDALRTAFDRA